MIDWISDTLSQGSTDLSQCIRPLQLSFACIAKRMVLLAVMVTSLLHSIVMHSYVTMLNTS